MSTVAHPNFICTTAARGGDVQAQGGEPGHQAAHQGGAGEAGPPVGAALGQAGLKIIEFTKDFNAKTSEIDVSWLSAGSHPVT